MSGEPNVIDYLADIPALSLSNVPEDTTGANLNDGGLSLLDLRNLGTVRTLVLVDGRRHVGAPQGAPQVDIDTIPALLIESVEVVTGGEFALYGADAVTGVVNFILKKDFQGLDVDGVVAQINQDGQLNGRISALVGETFDDRVNMYLFGEYQHSEEVRDADIDWRRDAWFVLNNDTDVSPATPDGQLDNILIRDARDAFFQRGGLVVLAGQVAASPASDPDIPSSAAARRCPTGGSTYDLNIASPIIGGISAANCFPIAPELGRVFVFDTNGTARPFDFGTFQDQNGLSRRVNIGGDGLNTGTEFGQGSRVPESTAYRFQTGVNVDVHKQCPGLFGGQVCPRGDLRRGPANILPRRHWSACRGPPAGNHWDHQFQHRLGQRFSRSGAAGSEFSPTRARILCPEQQFPISAPRSISSVRFAPRRTSVRSCASWGACAASWNSSA